MITKILLKRGTAEKVPELSLGEPAFLTDTKQLVVGNGTGHSILGESLVVMQKLPPKRPEEANHYQYSLNGHDAIDYRVSSSLDFTVARTSPNPNPMGDGAVSFGRNSSATHDDTFSAGYNSRAEGVGSFVCGQGGLASEGTCNAVTGYAVRFMGSSYSFGTGYLNSINNSYYCSVNGSNNLIKSSYYSTVSNKDNIASTYGINIFGFFNKEMTGSATSYSATNSAMAIGNGTSTSVRSNCFRVNYEGKVYGLSAFNSTGADYAEFFEWEDGNFEKEDRVGRFVKFSKGDKIVFCDANSSEILGIVSSTPAIIGNSQSDSWVDMYEKDDFGRTVYDITKTEEGEIVKTPKINPNYDSSLDYSSREDRDEWSAIGLIGRLRVLDDGSCVVGEYCTSGNEGIATSSENGYRVLKRISPTVIEVLFK